MFVRFKKRNQNNPTRQTGSNEYLPTLEYKIFRQNTILIAFAEGFSIPIEKLKLHSAKSDVQAKIHHGSK